MHSDVVVVDFVVPAVVVAVALQVLFIWTLIIVI